MSGRLQGKVAIVTGAASGFGKGIATKFVQEGAKVLIADLSSAAGQAVVEEFPPFTALFVHTDVTKKESWQRLLATALESFGRLDIIVNNAGTSYSNKPTEQVTAEEYDRVFEVNVRAMYVSTSVLLPYFLEKEAEGCFVQVASTAGVRPRPGLAWYCASKGAVITATKALAVEYAPKKIRFNSVSPVIGITGMTHLFLGKEVTAENLPAFVGTVPMGRPSTPEDVANACCYLASDEAGFITGVNLEVDGGRCI